MQCVQEHFITDARVGRSYGKCVSNLYLNLFLSSKQLLNPLMNFVINEKSYEMTETYNLEVFSLIGFCLKLLLN